eukprot:4930241-Pleurochrysis_carterae.AAC.13
MCPHSRSAGAPGSSARRLLHLRHSRRALVGENPGVDDCGEGRVGHVADGAAPGKERPRRAQVEEQDAREPCERERARQRVPVGEVGRAERDEAAEQPGAHVGGGRACALHDACVARHFGLDRHLCAVQLLREAVRADLVGQDENTRSDGQQAKKDDVVS